MKLKRLAVFLLLAAAPALFAGCAPAQSTSEFFAMDTVMQITVYEAGKEALAAAEAEVNRLDALLSISNTNSDIYRLNQNGQAQLSEETAAILSRACEIWEETGGAFDITIYPVMEIWGFYAGEPDAPENSLLQKALETVGCDKLYLNGNTASFGMENMGVDLGGIAKGYTAAAVANKLSENGVESAVISLGGNIRVLGEKPDGSAWQVAIQDPQNSGGYIGAVSVTDMAVVTAGSYQRYFDKGGVRYHHILDPKTGWPAQTGLQSVTVVSSDDMEADALSTAFFVMGMEKAVSYWRENGAFDIVFVTEEGEIWITEGLVGCFSSEREYEVIAIEE